MNTVSQNVSLLNIQDEKISSFLSFFNAPFISSLSSLDYASFMDRISSCSSAFIRNALISAIEQADRNFRYSPERIARYYVKQTRPRTIVTIFGEITFLRTEYQRRDNGKPYCYIDFKLGLRPRQRYDCCVEAKAKELYADHNSMIKVGKLLGEQIFSHFSIDANRSYHHLPRQTIYNLLHRTGKISVQPKEREMTPETLYIMADEKFIPIQRESTKEKPHKKEMVKVAVCFEGREQVLRKDGTKTKRYRLKNKYVFSSCRCEKEDFWAKLHTSLAYRYNLSKVKTIYIMGDGGSWIQNGVNALSMPGVRVKGVLDRYHAIQAIHRMTSDEAFQELLTMYLNSLKKEEFKCVSKIAESYLETEKQKEQFKRNYDYLIRHWSAFKTMVKEVKIGCTMEQAISHIIASLFTSVPKAYGRKNLPFYVNTRILFSK